MFGGAAGGGGGLLTKELSETVPFVFAVALCFSCI